MTDAEALRVIQWCGLVLMALGFDPTMMLDDQDYPLEDLALIMTHLALGAIITATTPLELPTNIPGWKDDLPAVAHVFDKSMLQ